MQKTSSSCIVSAYSAALLLLLLLTSMLILPACGSRGGRLLSPDHEYPCAEVPLQLNPESESAPTEDTLPHHQKAISNGGASDQILRGPLSSPSPLRISVQPLLVPFNGFHTSNGILFNMLPRTNPVPPSGPGTGHN
ncbi:hypothetical protein KP509_19G023200 [Ceratopteris richardii]|uniref:Uncharacterized protein n=1 Tax=Ceratopteris richardii TaxID=49495 RepID=A0A8T2SM69_CERRI|nr:hypothetical protein KP509_19G023200 [Ceratopteris richardii]